MEFNKISVQNKGSGAYILPPRRAGSKKGSGLGQPGYGLVEGGVIPGARNEENEPQGGEEGPCLPGKIIPRRPRACITPISGRRLRITRGDGGSGKTPTTEISPPPLQLSARCSLRKKSSPRMKTRFMGDVPLGIFSLLLISPPRKNMSGHLSP